MRPALEAVAAEQRSLFSRSQALRAGYTEREIKALTRPGAEIVAFNGRRMGGIVWVDARACAGEALASWIDLAAQFAGSLSPK